MLNPRPNLLYLVHRVPYPPDKGDRIRAFHILSYLAARADVFLASLADEPVAEETLAALQRLCRRVEVVPLGSIGRWLRASGSWLRGRTVTEGAFSSGRLRRVVREWASEVSFSAVLVSASSLVPYLRLPELRDVPKIVDLVDVDSEKWSDLKRVSRWPRSWIYRTEARRLRRLEQACAGWARAVTLVSDNEVQVYRRFCDSGTVCTVTNGVDLDYFRPEADATAIDTVEPACVFVGALDYRPNIDAACWFCDGPWRAIKAQRPRARLWLVGRRPAVEVQRLAEIAGVEVVGQVPDVRPYVARAAIAISPLRIARGLQNKVLEAMAMAKPVIASEASLAGLRNGAPLPAVVAASPTHWVEQVVRLLDNPRERAELGRAGRKYVEEHHAWERCLRPLARLLALSGAASSVAQAAAAG